MLVRNSIVTGLAAILISTAALADSTTKPATVKQKPTETTQKMADRCAALETQFDQVIATHGSVAKASAAKSLRSQAGSLCKSNNQAKGIKTLQQALKDLGVKPRA